MRENNLLPTSLRPLFDYPVRDTSICLGGDGWYYLTGTTGYPDWWGVTGDVQVWKSADLQEWTPIVTEPRKRSTVWNIDRDGTWQKEVGQRDGAPFRPLWAPEIHYLDNTYWIAYSIPRLGNGLLKSVSGRPEGPYEDNIRGEAPISEHIDASLFQDDDGSVYFLYDNGKIARMNESMTGLAEELRLLQPSNAEHVGFEGTFLFKAHGRYHLAGAEFIDGAYHCFVASAEHVYGPYGDRYLAIPHGGHNMFFKDMAGQWYSTFFGNSPHAPFQERPAILKVEFDRELRIRPVLDFLKG
ncbi:family 43 glycosylhydrolase [Paenibacillus alkaliterrae]|uniref:family 43 glycosylhydrolase n=1 Tax=Paenibacillus alkaliterrae TaxID=320909 RepID=UPI001F3C6C89|nr:family 43 glycosylhydrolase [Paenibacillus alkaliterrae]MCF2937759.1 family 43 glycosylhydrolase [Paenibacillus alkaliterrae]